MADVDISPNPDPFICWTSESEYIKKTRIRIHFFGQNPYESIYGLESEYILFFAIEYEYNYPWRDMDLSPKGCVQEEEIHKFIFFWTNNL